MLEGVFMEGHAFFKGTFHARSHFQGRSCVFQVDLPCQRLFSRKVGAFSWGPSMLEADFMEGGRDFMGTFRAWGHKGKGTSVMLMPCAPPEVEIKNLWRDFRKVAEYIKGNREWLLPLLGYKSTEGIE